MPDYSYSPDGVSFYGSYCSSEKAVEAAIKDKDCIVTRTCWVCENIDPTPIEELFDCDDIIQKVINDCDYSNEFTKDWPNCDDAALDELTTEIRKVISWWLDKHEVRPDFSLIKNIRKHLW